MFWYNSLFVCSYYCASAYMSVSYKCKWTKQKKLPPQQCFRLVDRLWKLRNIILYCCCLLATEAFVGRLPCSYGMGIGDHVVGRWWRGIIGQQNTFMVLRFCIDHSSPCWNIHCVILILYNHASFFLDAVFCSALCVMLFKLILVLLLVDILLVNCVWLAFGKVVAVFVHCVKSLGRSFLQSTLTLGKLVYFSIKSLPSWRLCYRDQIQRSYTDEVTQRREQYNQEDMDLLQHFLYAKEHFWEPSSNLQELTLTNGGLKEQKRQRDQTGNNNWWLWILLY